MENTSTISFLPLKSESKWLFGISNITQSEGRKAPRATQNVSQLPEETITVIMRPLRGQRENPGGRLRGGERRRQTGEERRWKDTLTPAIKKGQGKPETSDDWSEKKTPQDKVTSGREDTQAAFCRPDTTCAKLPQ